MLFTLIKPMVTLSIRKFFLPFFLCAFVTVFAYAQTQEDFIGEGPKGRYSREQAQEVALRYLYGEVLDTDMYSEKIGIFYTYTIQTPDDSIYELVINAVNGEIHKVKVVSLSKKPRYPRGMIEVDLATEIALSEVKTRGKGRMKSKVLDSAIAVYESKLAYQVHVEKSVRVYRVLVDGFSGKILYFGEED